MKALSSVILASSLAISQAECPNACSGHGVCGAKDMCTCDRNWQGSDCSLRKSSLRYTTTLSPDTPHISYLTYCIIFIPSKGTCPFGLSHVDIPKGDLDASTSVEDISVNLISGSTVYPFGTTEAYPRMEDTDGTVNINTAHDYAECSNKGLCDRKTGECECLAGYDGAACQRASCPSEVGQKRTTGETGKTNSIFINQRGLQSSIESVFKGESLANVQINECSGHGTCNTIEELAKLDGNNIYELWDKDASMGCSCDPG